MDTDKKLIDDDSPRVNYKKRFRVCLVILTIVLLLAIASFVVLIVSLI